MDDSDNEISSFRRLRNIAAHAPHIPSLHDDILLHDSRKEEIIEVLKQEIRGLKEEIKGLKEQITLFDKEFDNQAKNQDNLFQLIDKLSKKPEPTERTRSHLDELHRLMIEDKTSQVSIRKASLLLKLSKERVRQLKPLILADGRFEAGWTTIKGQKVFVFKIRQYIK